MNIYLLRLKESPTGMYGNSAYVVVATKPSEAREIVSDNHGVEGWKPWLTAEGSAIKKIGEKAPYKKAQILVQGDTY